MGNKSQRAEIASLIANMRQGGDRRSDQSANLPLETTTAEAAAMLNVSERLVKTALHIEKHLYAGHWPIWCVVDEKGRVLLCRQAEAEARKETARIANMPNHRPTDKGANLHSSAEAAQELKETELAKGTAGQGRPSLGGHVVLPPKEDTAPTLSEIGITKQQSSEVIL